MQSPDGLEFAPSNIKQARFEMSLLCRNMLWLTESFLASQIFYSVLLYHVQISSAIMVFAASAATSQIAVFD